MKGQWLWCHYPPDAATLVARLRACGASGVLLKYHDGNSCTDNTGYDYRASFCALVGPLKAAGFGVAAWGYWYPGDTPASIAALVAQAVRDGAEWYCIDAEAEFEIPGAAGIASGILAAVKGAVPGLHLAYAPLPYADLHAAFPYHVFDSACQLCMPQIYWRDLGDSPSAAYNRCWESFSAASLIGPGHASWQPIGQTDAGVTPGDVGTFAVACHGNGVQPISGISWWVLDDQPAEMDAAVAASPYASTVVPPAAAPASVAAPAGGDAALRAALQQIHDVATKALGGA